MWPFKSKDWNTVGLAWTASTVEAQLTAALAPAYISLRDNDFRAIPQKDFEDLIFHNWFPNDEPAYKAESFDCDKFAVCFMAAIYTAWAKKTTRKESLCFGYIQATMSDGCGHAFIWHMDDKGIVRFYEPQTGGLVNYSLKSVDVVES